MNIKMNILLKGIQVKLDRGEELETILQSYVNLTDEEKDCIRQSLKNN